MGLGLHGSQQVSALVNDLNTGKEKEKNVGAILDSTDKEHS